MNKIKSKQKLKIVVHYPKIQKLLNQINKLEENDGMKVVV